MKTIFFYPKQSGSVSVSGDTPDEILTKMVRGLKMGFKTFDQFLQREFPTWDCMEEGNEELLEDLKDAWSKYDKYSYEEVFSLSENDMSYVFQYLEPRILFENLNPRRIKVDGKEVRRKKFQEDGSFEWITKTSIYETHEIEGEKISERLREEKVYAVKCWCDSTGGEAWLWIDGEHKDDPLSAISSCCVLPSEVFDNKMTFMRQGDIFIVESDAPLDSKPRAATKEEYFDLCVAET